jgi:hypothetical protein
LEKIVWYLDDSLGSFPMYAWLQVDIGSKLGLTDGRLDYDVDTVLFDETTMDLIGWPCHAALHNGC